MGIHHSPHTHPIPMGIPIPTAALQVADACDDNFHLP